MCCVSDQIVVASCAGQSRIGWGLFPTSLSFPFPGDGWGYMAEGLEILLTRSHAIRPRCRHCRLRCRVDLAEPSSTPKSLPAICFRNRTMTITPLGWVASWRFPATGGGMTSTHCTSNLRASSLDGGPCWGADRLGGCGKGRWTVLGGGGGSPRRLGRFLWHRDPGRS
jgi:hypothetical protein